jgi:PucR C-terminal helix-turn-helix domain/GGDEF-like domain
MAANSTHQGGALGKALAGLSKLGITPRLGASLGKGPAKIAKQLREAVVTEIAAFTASGNPDVLPDLDRHAGEHIAELQRLLAGGSVGDFEFVRAHARRRAGQRFPLEAMLHAYRCGHKVLSPWIREGAIAMKVANIEQVLAAIADFSIEYTDAISIAAAGEYVAQTRILAEAEGDLRTELLNVLVSGYDEADGRVARLLKRAGYLEQRRSFCVALAQSTDPLEMENPARANRIIEAVMQAVTSIQVRALVGVRNNVVTAVFSDVRRASGWTAPQANLADRIRPHLLTLGPAVLIGLSSDQPSTAFIPRGLHEATVALDFATVTERVVSFTELPIRRLLIHRGADYVQSAMPVWFPAFHEADAKSQGALTKTLRALADADMNVQRAGRELHVHPNTIYARIERITDLTGLDAQRFHDLTDLLLAAECGRALPSLPLNRQARPAY